MIIEYVWCLPRLGFISRCNMHLSIWLYIPHCNIFRISCCHFDSVCQSTWFSLLDILNVKMHVLSKFFLFEWSRKGLESMTLFFFYSASLMTIFILSFYSGDNWIRVMIIQKCYSTKLYSTSFCDK